MRDGTIHDIARDLCESSDGLTPSCNPPLANFIPPPVQHDVTLRLLRRSPVLVPTATTLSTNASTSRQTTHHLLLVSTASFLTIRLESSTASPSSRITLAFTGCSASYRITSGKIPRQRRAAARDRYGERLVSWEEHRRETERINVPPPLGIPRYRLQEQRQQAAFPPYSSLGRVGPRPRCLRAPREWSLGLRACCNGVLDRGARDFA